MGVFLSFFFLLFSAVAVPDFGASCASAGAAIGLAAAGFVPFVSLLFFLCGVADDEEEDALGLELDAFVALALDLDFLGLEMDLPLTDLSLLGAGMVMCGAGSVGIVVNGLGQDSACGTGGCWHGNTMGCVGLTICAH